MKHRWQTFGALLLFTIACLEANATEAPTVIRAQAPAVEGWMQAYFAQQTGRFEKAGLNVDLTVPSSASTSLRQLRPATLTLELQERRQSLLRS